jgi:LacI family transcriptional regulator
VPGVGWVRADEEGGAFEATRHLIELGHCEIGLVSERSEANSVVCEREAGMRRALTEAGLRGHTQRWFGDWTFDSGYNIGLEIARSGHRPSALFVLNELMAAGCLRAFESCGHELPRDLAVVTVEDSRLVDYVRPALTAVHVPMYEVATRAAEMLLAAIEGGDRGRGDTLATEFVVRASSTAPGRPEAYVGPQATRKQLDHTQITDRPRAATKRRQTKTGQTKTGHTKTGHTKTEWTT